MASSPGSASAGMANAEATTPTVAAVTRGLNFKVLLL